MINDFLIYYSYFYSYWKKKYIYIYLLPILYTIFIITLYDIFLLYATFFLLIIKIK